MVFAKISNILTSKQNSAIVRNLFKVSSSTAYIAAKYGERKNFEDYEYKEAMDHISE